MAVWWGLFDHELFVEFRERRFGPYPPGGGAIPLHRYRKPRASASQKRADRIGDLASKLSVPRAALNGVGGIPARAAVLPLRGQPFVDPHPHGQLTCGSRLDALRGVSNLLNAEIMALYCLKRLMEVIICGGSLSVAMIGHPKLRNDLRRPCMEEIGHRTDILSFEGLGGGIPRLPGLAARRVRRGGDRRGYPDRARSPGCDGHAPEHASAVCRTPHS